MWELWRSNATSTAANAAIVLIAAAGLWVWRHQKESSLTVSLNRIPTQSLRFNLAILGLDVAFVGLICMLLMIQMRLGVARTGLGLDQAIYDYVPAIVVAFGVLLVGDFIAYWRHRLEHSAIFWPSHVMHHSDEQMTWWAIHRFHPINRLTTLVIDAGVLLVMGFPVWATVLNGFVRHYYGAFIHMDLPWTYGRAGKWLVSPAMHRWHHVREGKGVGSNFATLFAIFDRAFGTFYLPGPCNQPLGVPDVPGNALRFQLWLPFYRWFDALRTWSWSVVK